MTKLKFAKPPRSKPKPKKALPKGTKPIKKVNRKAMAKRMSRYSKFIASAAWKRLREGCIRLAEGRCEFIVKTRFYYTGGPEGGELLNYRCPEAANHAHHKTYARFGGKELPEDLQALCDHHHDEIHATRIIPPRFKRAA
jgi:hypothetical protein